MSDFVKQSTEAAEQYMNFLAKAQEQVLENVRQIASFQVADFPQVNLPQAPALDLPSAREVAQVAFSFVEKLTAQQHAFVKQYLDATENKAQESASATSAASADAAGAKKK